MDSDLRGDFMDLVTLAAAKKYTRDQIKTVKPEETDLSAYAKTSYVDEKVASIVESAPDTLNTLNELAAALGDDPNFATTIAKDIGSKVPSTRTVNNKALSANISLTASDVGAVPTTRTVNGKVLSSNITLSAADVKALPDTTTIPSIEGLATTDYVDSAVANIILTSESGNKFKLTVADDGTLTATAVTE
jgi:hypothetical protein